MRAARARLGELTLSAEGKSFWWHLPGYEGSYDADLEAKVVGHEVHFTLITHNPNYGGGSGLGAYSVDELRRRAVQAPITAEHCDEVLAAIAPSAPSGTSR